MARAGNTCSEIAFCHGPKSKGGTWWNLSLDEDEDDEDDKEDVDEKDEEEDDEDKEEDENDEEDEAEEDETDEEDEDVDEDEDEDEDDDDDWWGPQKKWFNHVSTLPVIKYSSWNYSSNIIPKPAWPPGIFV